MGSLGALRDQLRNDPPVVSLFEVGDLITARLPSGRDEVKGTIDQIKELGSDGLCAFIHVCDEDCERIREPDWKLWVSLKTAALLARARNGLKLTFDGSISDDDLKNMGRRAHDFLGWPEGSRIQISTGLRDSENVAWLIDDEDDVYECEFEASGVFMTINIPHKDNGKLFGSEIQVSGELLNSIDRLLLTKGDWESLLKRYLGWPTSTTIDVDRDINTSRVHLLIKDNNGRGSAYAVNGTWPSVDCDDRAFILPKYDMAFDDV